MNTLPSKNSFSRRRLLLKLTARPEHPKPLDYEKLSEKGAPEYETGYYERHYGRGFRSLNIRTEIWSRGLFQYPLRIERTDSPHCREKRIVADEILVHLSREGGPDGESPRKTRKRALKRVRRKLKRLGLKPKSVCLLSDTAVVLVRRSKLARFLPWKRKYWKPLRKWLPWAEKQAQKGGFRSDEVEPNVVFGAASMNVAATPDSDPLYKEQWDHYTIRTKSAQKEVRQLNGWNDPDNVVRVAVIDSGVDPRHEDLEIDYELSRSFVCGRGWLCRVFCWLRDKMPLGLIKALYWWLEKPYKSPEAYDDEWHSHGTACSAPIGARVDNPKGLIGVGLNTKVVALKFMGADGTGTGFDASCAIRYALENNIKILLLAWGGSCEEEALKEALQDAKCANAVVVTAAGNREEDIQRHPCSQAPYTLRDGPYFYPASYALDNMLVVGGTWRKKKNKGCWYEGRVKGSNYSKELVHLGAPGLQCKSTRAGRPFSGESHRYGYFSGTSAAAALVAGTCALVRLALEQGNVTNTIPYDDIIQPILKGAKYVPGLDFKCCRRLDAKCAVLLALGHHCDCTDPCEACEQQTAKVEEMEH